MRRLAGLVTVFCLWLFLIPGVAPAAMVAANTYSLEASSQVPWEWTDFSVAWTDANHDGLLQLGEVLAGGFSGITYLPFVWFHEQLEAVPFHSAQSPYTGGSAPEWVFSGAMGPTGADSSLFSYNRVVLSPAPIPASALLLGSGLVGLGLLGWRRQRG